MRGDILKKRLVLIVSYFLVALIFFFAGYFIRNYTQSIKINDISFATISNELSEDNSITILDASDAKEIIKRLSTQKDNNSKMAIVFPIRIRIYDFSGKEIYTFTTAIVGGEVVSEIRSGGKSYTTDEEFTSFIEGIIEKYNISIW